MSSTSRFVATCTVVLATVLFAVHPARAQYDHLKCYKTKDQKTFKTAQADLTALQDQFGIAENCQVKPKAKLFCVPAAKSVTSIEDGADTPFAAEELGFDRLCYKIKCPKIEIAPQVVGDQFGVRTIEKFKAQYLCTPAVKGPLPTTTTTTLPPECTGSETQPCGSDVGECAKGLQICTDGAWGSCIGEIQATEETCDGLDNDCDGTVDNGNPGSGGACSTGLAGACDAGTLNCAAGTLVCSQVVFPSAETCDGLDNDCDGAVDNGDPGGGLPCSTGLLGVCDAGSTQCSAGTLDCRQVGFPSTETCDGLDNDCDGAVDNGDPGGGIVCSTGLLGVCESGLTSCAAGSLVCKQDALAGEEICDGLDNDCDGFTDEDFDLSSNLLHCGACNSPCALSEQCVEGICVPI